jgi:serine/threonine protein kinase
MLKKNPKKRITLNELLKHPWLTMNCTNIRTMRENPTTENIFRMNALSKPMAEEIIKEEH